MKIGFLTKRRDACYQIRVFLPSTHLGYIGHEIKEELLELQAHCPRCNTQGMHEFQLSDGDQFACPQCRTDFGISVPEWRQSVEDIINWSDVVVFQRPTDLAHLRLMRRAQELGKKTVFEGDDDYINVPTWNPGYKYYIDRRGIVEEMLRINHGISVTTEALKSVYDPYNKNVQVLPNSIDVEIVDCEPKLPEIPMFNKLGFPVSLQQYEEIRKTKQVIGWGGSPTHELDLELTVEALRRVLRKEEAVLVMVGYVHQALIDIIPADQLFLVSLVACSHYFPLYKTLKFDVGMAPVAPVKFNESKSPNKLIEYHTMGIFGVASDFVTYRDHIHRGFLASPNDEIGWVSALRWALNSHGKDREERLAANRKFVEENYDIKKTIHLWDNFYKNLLQG